ncbi:uncharacterized protein LOC119698759 isoform X2 [Motacilla alba alba]|uniref:uncharacterized protein LOC119698759 isoform X2 n=1 Tax=Motacilla alba alba TaxID=1094192 RepID=UPI0018D530FD|nr:uncharacterized protein LOC119698759 isoform X2 [Motacilla alba alba]
MIFLLQYFFLLATDLVLAMTLSCLFYAFASIGRMFARNLDRAGFGVSAAQWSAQEERTVTEECSSNKEVAQLHLTEDEYQKTVKTFIESHLSLKGMYGKMRKPSILIWDEGTPDTQGVPETKPSCEGKAFKAPRRNCLLQTALCISVLFHPLTCVLTLLKRSPQLLVSLLKSKN